MTTSYELENGHPEHYISETDPDDSDASEEFINGIETWGIWEWDSEWDCSPCKRRRIQILARATVESEKLVLILKTLCRVSPLASVESFIVLY